GTNLSFYFPAGTVFKMHADGSGFILLHSFGAASNDGAFPEASLLLAKDGILYGTAAGQGSPTGGDGFCLKTNGTDFLVLHNSANDLQHGAPQTLMQGEDRFLYGLTSLPGSGIDLSN